MSKRERMHALVASGDRDGAVAIAHELLTAHGHESAEEAREAYMKHGFPGEMLWDVWNEAFKVVNGCG